MWKLLGLSIFLVLDCGQRCGDIKTYSQLLEGRALIRGSCYLVPNILKPLRPSTKTIMDFPCPQNKRQLMRFFCMAGY